MVLGKEEAETHYDFTQAAERIRGTEYPQAEDFAVQSVLTPPLGRKNA